MQSSNYEISIAGLDDISKDEERKSILFKLTQIQENKSNI